MLKEPGIDWNSLKFSRKMAARTPCNASGEDDNGGKSTTNPKKLCWKFAYSCSSTWEWWEIADRSRLDTSCWFVFAQYFVHSHWGAPQIIWLSDAVVIKMWQVIWDSAWSGCQQKNMVTTRSGECKVFPVKNTKLFVCLSRTNNQDVPSMSGKISLRFAGLGKEKVVFQKDGKASHVFRKLVGEFPPLAEGGGFEILRTMENSTQKLNDLPVPPRGYTAA